MDLIAGEIEVIEKYIFPDSIVFDVGGCVGEWALEVLDRGLASHLHIFEPIPSCFQSLLSNLDTFKDKTTVNNLAVGKELELSPFWFYGTTPVLSTLYKRNPKTMERFGVQEPEKIMVNVITIDEYCRHYGIGHIDFLKIDVEGAEADVIAGAKNLISNQNIKHIQFEYGGCFVDSGITLEEIFLYLREKGYAVGKIIAGDVQIISQFMPEMENYEYCNYLGILQDENILHKT